MREVLLALIGLAAGWVGVWVAGIGLGRTSPELGDAWPVRARQVYPARLAGGALTLLSPLICVVTLTLDVGPEGDPRLLLGRLTLAVALSFGCLAGALLAGWARERRVMPGGMPLAPFARVWVLRLAWLGASAVFPLAGLAASLLAPGGPLVAGLAGAPGGGPALAARGGHV